MTENTMMPIYLDYAATTPVDARVAAQMLPWLTQAHYCGNPAATHRYGRTAHAAIEEARKQVADLIQADAQEIIWTSGATEANNLAIKGAAYFYQHKGRHIITSQTEHEAVLESCRQLEREGFAITYLRPKKNGLLGLAQIAAAIRVDTILVSIMHVNNEIGVMQDIAAIGALLHQRAISFHVDAAQSVGKVSINLTQLPVDLMSFSAHKIYGPKGMGALYIRRKSGLNLRPLLHGGGQEKGLRSGTLATHQIVGMGAAFALAQQEMANETSRITQLRERLWQGLSALGDVYRNGDMQQSVAGILNVTFVGIANKVLLPALQDLAVSAGSACHAESTESSRVLLAIGLDDTLAQSSIRFSLGRFTTAAEVDYAIEKVTKVIQALREVKI